MNQPSVQPPQKKQKAQKFGVVALIVLAIIVIAASLFMVFNPNGIETTSDVQDISVTLGDAEPSPQTVRIAKGATITWENIGSAPRHLVMTSSEQQQGVEGFGDDEGIQPDESYSFTFDTKGSFTYQDTTNPEKINGTIIVE
jgi:plastocyanin